MMLQTKLGDQAAAVDAAAQALADNDILTRIWDLDHTVWQEDPTEISNRLGWLDIAERLTPEIDRLGQILADAKSDGMTHVLLMGMGGSSLAPELFSLIFGQSSDGLELAVIDSTSPDYVAEYEASLDMSKTVFIVATKSGGTVETLSAFKYFYNLTAAAVGVDKAGNHFIAITDPGSKLVTLAEQYRFRETVINDPNIGGRYSALSFFGLVPAALVGLDVGQLLGSAVRMMADRAVQAQLGAIWGGLWQTGRDKLTITTSAEITPFGDWAEQLIAESVGKDGKGILPVVGEPLSDPAAYGTDRLFIDLRLAGDLARDGQLDALAAAGHPVIIIEIDSIYELGGQFLLWEVATAVAGHIMQVHPFNQPNVETAKISARAMVKAYEETGEIPAGEPAPLGQEALNTFLAQAQPGDYISLQAYVYPNEEATAALSALQTALRDQTKLAVTTGFGPRFLHSTGQLHKGDSGNGLFVQFTYDSQSDRPIPDTAGEAESTMSFGVLLMAQALGDHQALVDAGRRVIRFHLGQADAADAIRSLI